jgi:hypothetical protein
LFKTRFSVFNLFQFTSTCLPIVLLLFNFHFLILTIIIFSSLTVVRTTMPLRKGSSVSLPSETFTKEQHPLKRKQPLSFEDRSAPTSVTAKPSKNRLIRSNDLLTQTPIEVLLDMLKQFAGVKEISDETQVHLFMVKITLQMM